MQQAIQAQAQQSIQHQQAQSIYAPSTVYTVGGLVFTDHTAAVATMNMDRKGLYLA